MRTWFNRNTGAVDLEGHEPADASLAHEYRAHRLLDTRLKSALGSLAPGRVDEKRFQNKLAASLASARQELSAAEKWSQTLDRFFGFLRADSYAVLRYASVLLIPLAGLAIYSVTNSTAPSQVAAREEISAPGLSEDMAPDAGPTAAERDSALHKMGGGSPDEVAVPRAAMVAADVEFERVTQETLLIQEGLLKKNLEMASNAAARKSALEQLLDFYVKNGNANAAKKVRTELSKGGN